MPVRNGVLARSTSGAAGPYAVGTVGLSETWILKDIRLYNHTVAGVLSNVYLTNPGSGVVAPIIQQSVAAGGFFDWSGWVAAGPGDQLFFNPGAANQDIWVSGADLPGHL